MSDQRGIAYKDLEVRIEDRPNKDGINVQETFRRLHFQRDERYHQVPTEDFEVRRALSLLNEPESKAGEDDYGRRERLIVRLANDWRDMDIFEAVPLNKRHEAVETQSCEDEEDEEFYTPASQKLIEARKFLVKFSIHRGRKRLEKETKDITSLDIKREITGRRNLAQRLKNLTLSGSQIASTRPISHVKLSPNDTYAAIGSWDGSVKTISLENLGIVDSVAQAHNGKVGEVDWSPTGDLLATGGEDGLIKIYSADFGKIELKTTIQGHDRRVAGTKFHPSGNYVASASFDNTWRLWDVQTGQELLLQEGHGKEVYCVAFQCDGALFCSGGFDFIPMVWDIRSGKCVMSLSGHVKPVYSVDWSPNGYNLATASGDGTVNIWDVRRTAQAQSILAHDSTVSAVRFEKSSGKFLASAGYDKDIKIYSSDNWLNVAVLKGHNDKILSLDIARNGSRMVSAGWDRSIKSWIRD